MRILRKSKLAPIYYKGFSIRFCPWCGTQILWLPDSRDLTKKVAVTRSSWEFPLDHRHRLYIRRFHRRHYCPAGRAAMKSITLHEQRITRPIWAQTVEFDEWE